MSYHSGQQVRIIANYACHHFNEGDIVTLYYYFPDGHYGDREETSEQDFERFWSTSPDQHDGGCVEASDIEPIKEGVQLVPFAEWLKQIEHIYIPS